jgi:protein-L-isoaspartate(D-aspartate) O-methyltransferase
MWFKPSSENIIKAWKAVKREDFLPLDQQDKASLDIPLPLGWGQTNSQPSTVAFMLELLQPQTGGRYLDIGSGSGWTTALLAEIVGPKGLVCAIEMIPELKEMGQVNLEKAGYSSDNIKLFVGDGCLGRSDCAPFDGILVSASANTVPKELKLQLGIGGRLVVPIKNEIRKIIRISEKEFQTETFPGFVFVPLLSSDE